MFFAQVLACSTNNQYLCGWDASVRLWMQMLQAQTCRPFFENSLKMTFCMETNTKPLTEEDYYDSLRIKSEKDLLEPGKTEYDFIFSDLQLRSFYKETDHLQSMIDYAIVEMYRFKIKHRTFHNFCSFSEILILNLNEYIETLRHLHRKVYKTIYGNYADEISRSHYDKLGQPLSRLREVAVRIKDQLLWPMMKDEAKHEALQRIIGHELECGWRRVTIEELRQRKDRIAYEYEADLRDIPDGLIFEIPDEWIDNMPDDSAKISALETIMSVLTLIAGAVGEIEIINQHILTVFARRNISEIFIIYSCMKRQFEEERKKDILAYFSAQQDRYRKDRQLPLDSQYLRKLLDETEQEFNQNDLCKMWHEWSAPIEYFAFECALMNLPKEEFDRLFEYQAKCEMIKGMIADVRNSEQGRDPLFAAWVDPIKLERYLQAWIEVKVTTQEKWYVVWCLMKYTFGIIKPEAKKQDFVKKMGLMFPDAPKKCVAASFRKQEPKMNHNCHFSEWLKIDPDYDMAKDLYEKLKNKERYEREETDR